jgi:hypothetical protein
MNTDKQKPGFVTGILWEFMFIEAFRETTPASSARQEQRGSEDAGRIGLPEVGQLGFAHR